MKITVCEVSRILRGRNAIFPPGWQGSCSLVSLFIPATQGNDRQLNIINMRHIRSNSHTRFM